MNCWLNADLYMLITAVIPLILLVSGYVNIPMSFLCMQVPGNFHISTHAAHQQPPNPDMTHIIHEMSMGDRIPKVELLLIHTYVI